MFPLLMASLRNALALLFDLDGRMLWASPGGRGSGTNFGIQPGELIGDRVPGPWSDERVSLIRRSVAEHTIFSLYSILQGRRNVMRFAPLYHDDADLCLVTTERLTRDQFELALTSGPDESMIISRTHVLGHLDALTARELEVLALIGEGRRPKEIAKVLCRSVSTVEGHRERIGQKLGVCDRAELLVHARCAGLQLEDAECVRAEIVTGDLAAARR